MRIALTLSCAFGIAALAAWSPPTTAPGGSYEQSALSGCMNQWLFNGVWRLRVVSVSPIVKENVQYPGYAVRIEARNGSHRTASWVFTGVADPTLVLSDGSILELDTDDTIAWHPDSYKELPQSAGFTHTLNYYMDSKVDSPPKAAKLLIQIDPSKEGGSEPRYTTKTPSLRVDLTCSK